MWEAVPVRGAREAAAAAFVSLAVDLLSIGETHDGPNWFPAEFSRTHDGQIIGKPQVYHCPGNPGSL